MTRSEGPGGKRIQIVAVHTVIQEFDGMGDKTGGVRDGRIVGLLEGSIDCGKSEGGRIQTTARAGNRSHGEKVVRYVGGLVGGGIRGAIVENQTVVGSALNRMLALHPGYVVHQVVRGHVDDAGR